ncbi:MAG: hypothetical protein SPJ34_06690 [Candidatus Ornithospirochaeta sp.]|nr:hypothetical protein [Candidatus Ornithospirochaeta sp.]
MFRKLPDFNTAAFTDMRIGTSEDGFRPVYEEARANKRLSDRCPVCGRKCPAYDHGGGRVRMRRSQQCRNRGHRQQDQPSDKAKLWVQEHRFNAESESRSRKSEKSKPYFGIYQKYQSSTLGLLIFHKPLKQLLIEKRR